MYIEQIAQHVYSHLHHNDVRFALTEYERKFLDSVCQRAVMSLRLSTAQSHVLIKIFRNKSSLFWKLVKGISSEQEFIDYIERPRFKLKPYQTVVVEQEARYIGNGLMALRGKSHSDHGFRDRLYYLFHPEENIYLNLERCWLIRVGTHNAADVFTFIRDYKFKIDDQTKKFILGCIGAEKKENMFFYDEESEKVVATIPNSWPLNYWLINSLGVDSQ